MIKQLKYLAFISILAFFSFSCSDKIITNILPISNFDNLYKNDTINSNKDEYSVYQRASLNNCKECFDKEYMDKNVAKVKTNNEFFKEFFDTNFVNRNKIELNNITKFIQNVQFLSNNTGFVSIAHNGDSSFNKLFDLPFNDHKGGTDIFSFEKNKNTDRIEFSALPSSINSIFWDSHPWSMQDSNCNLVLVWSSDKDNPFTEVKNIKNKTIKAGNTDLYYSFYVDKKWSEVRQLDTTGLLNSPKNEFSPFIICNVAPKLFYSSNVAGSDYDLYVADLDIDYQNQIVKLINDPIMLNKGKDTSYYSSFINSEYDEKFPYVKLPLNDKSKTQTLLFSSNRNNTPKPFDKFGDTIIVNKGGFDIYSLNFDLDCKPREIPKPKIVEVIKPQQKEITYKLKLIDNENKNREILKPIIILKNKTNNTLTKFNESQIEVKLDPNSEYEIYAGSDYQIEKCGDLFDNNILNYNAFKITENKPTINIRKELKDYDSIISPRKIVKYDTIKTKEIVPVDGLNQFSDLNKNNIEEIKSSNNHLIVNSQKATIEKTIVITEIKPLDIMIPSFKSKNENILVQTKVIEIETKFTFKQEESKNSKQTKIKEKLVNAVEITKLQITKNEWYEGKDTITKQRTLVFYDTIPQYDTTKIKIESANSRTKLTMLGNIITDNLNEIATIYKNQYKNVINDTLYLIPETYKMPSCEYTFDSDKVEFYKNVPYFQTAFWEVNASDNLKRHKQELQKDGRLGKATCIDLNYSNTRFGYGRTGIIEDGKRINRDTITKNYEDYAIEVDKNLKRMADTITKQFMNNLYIFRKVNRKAKLFITMEAYSDKRGAAVCDYFGPDVKFNNLIFKSDLTIPQLIDVKKEYVNNKFSLGADNENLSLLRAYFGFKELLNILMKNKEFSELYKIGKVYDPTNTYDTSEEILKKIEECDIIFATYGKGIDPTDAKSNVTDYDKVRRLNLKIEILEYENGTISTNSCCR